MRSKSVVTVSSTLALSTKSSTPRRPKALPQRSPSRLSPGEQDDVGSVVVDVPSSWSDPTQAVHLPASASRPGSTLTGRSELLWLRWKCCMDLGETGPVEKHLLGAGNHVAHLTMLRSGLGQAELTEKRMGAGTVVQRGGRVPRRSCANGKEEFRHTWRASSREGPL